MQHTEQYQLNLIERDDAFSPDPLNENMQTVDQALHALDQAQAAEAQTRQEAVEALGQQVKSLSIHRFATGTYSKGQGTSTYVSLGFTPKLVLVQVDNGGIAFATTAFSAYNGDVTISGAGFTGSGSYAGGRGGWYFALG